jgi:hypothetical protein
MRVSHAPPDDPTDPKHWAILFTRARLRKGWSYVRLSIEAETSHWATVNACLRGTCDGKTILKLAAALEINVIPPFTPPLTARQAQHG